MENAGEHYKAVWMLTDVHTEKSFGVEDGIIEVGFTETTHWHLIIFKNRTLKITCDWGSISFKSQLDHRSLNSRVERPQPKDFNDFWARLWPNLQPLQRC